MNKHAMALLMFDAGLVLLKGKMSTFLGKKTINQPTLLHTALTDHA